MRKLLNPFRRGRSLAIDVGSRAVKWVWMDVERNRILQCGAVPRGELGGLDAHLPAEAAGANTAVQGLTTAYGYLELPVLTDDEFRVAVKAEAQQWIPFPLDQAEFRAQRTPSLHGGEQVGAFYAAALRNPVEELRSALQRLGRPALRVEVPALALAREHRRNHPELAQQFCGLVHIGYGLCHFVLARDGYPYYARDFVPGCSEFLLALEAELAGNREAAEEVFRLADFRMPALGPPLTRLLETLRRTLRYCGAHAVPLYLSGGGCTGNLASVLAAGLGVQVVKDCWNRVQGQSEWAPLFKLAVGLALP